MKDMKPDFVVKEGQESAKAKDFMAIIGRTIDGMRSMPIADMAYKVLDTLYTGLSQTDRDFGYNVAMVTEDTPYIEDIMYEADYDLYRQVVDSHGNFGQEDHGFMTREECFKTFWHVCAQQVMQDIPLHDFDKAKLHIESNIAGMFCGFNRYNYTFILTYVEQDDEDKVFYRTRDLGSILTPTTFSF